MEDNALLTPERFAQLKTIALLIFFAAFVAILGWLLFSRSSKFKEASRIPLEDDSPGPARPGDHDENRGTKDG